MEDISLLCFACQEYSMPLNSENIYHIMSTRNPRYQPQGISPIPNRRPDNAPRLRVIIISSINYNY